MVWKNNKLSSVDVAYVILKESRIPMTPKQLINLGMKEHGLIMQGKTPECTLSANFINEIKRRMKQELPQRFIRIRRGHWGLVEYIGEFYSVDDNK